MGIHDRDWYRQERRQQRGEGARSSASSSFSRAKQALHFDVQEPIVRRIQVFRSTYDRWLASLRTGLPLWFLLMIWACVLVGLVAFFQHLLRLV